MTKRVALIGCGSIGSELALNIDNQKIPNCSLSIIFDIDEEKSRLIYEKLIRKPLIFNDFADFINSPQFKEIDLVIEAASIQAALNYGLDIIGQKKDFMFMSIGAFSNPVFYEKVIDLVQTNFTNVFLPSGAIGGIDIIRTVRNYIESIVLITTKNNRSLKGAPFFKNKNIDIDTIKEKQIIFEGNAKEAIDEFPSNVNVSALISLAGIGFNKTRVKIVVDPDITNNMHEIYVKWAFGEFSINVVNKPSPDNPKTSYLAVLSAIECLRTICTTNLKIGS